MKTIEITSSRGTEAWVNFQTDCIRLEIRDASDGCYIRAEEREQILGAPDERGKWGDWPNEWEREIWRFPMERKDEVLRILREWYPEEDTIWFSSENALRQPPLPADDSTNTKGAAR